MSFFCQLLNDYDKFFKPNEKPEKAKDQPLVYDKPAFVQACSEEFQMVCFLPFLLLFFFCFTHRKIKFLGPFVEVQMFEEFVRAREKGNIGSNQCPFLPFCNETLTPKKQRRCF